MQSTRGLALGIVSMIVLVLAAALLLVWPGYRQTMHINTQLGGLEGKVRQLSGLTLALEVLAGEVDAERHRIDREFRRIPESADMADLMRTLSLPVDELNVRDQTFAASAAGPAVVNADLPMQAMPVTVEMTATFDTVFDLLRRAESMNRLVRISSMRMRCDRAQDDEDPAHIVASIALEAIFAPPVDAEGS